MTPFPKEPSIVDFEIDQAQEYAQFLLSNRREIIFYLNILTKRRSLFTAYINEGKQLFLTTIVAVDEVSGQIFLDPVQTEENNVEASTAQQITLVGNLDNVKIQIRLSALQAATYQDQKVLAAAIPEQILRLQRREFFRLEPPISKPIHCKLATLGTEGSVKTLELQLADISGGGLCLIGPTPIAEHFPRNSMFQHCRLEIPGEGVIQVNLRIHKTVEISTRDGQHHLRIGCEFVNLPGARLAFIERYITRIERERKARDTGLTA